MEGLEPPSLRRGELVGDGEGGELVEGCADVAQPVLELGGARRDGRGIWLGTQAAEGLVQQHTPVDGVGAGEELDEDERLSRAQPVALGALKEFVLLVDADFAQGARQRRADGAPGQSLLGSRRES